MIRRLVMLAELALGVPGALVDRLVRRFDRWVLQIEAARPAGPEVGAIDDDGSFCTGEPGKDVAEDRVFISQPLYALRTSCCNGTGFADYAAVPCPAPGCPAVKAALRNAFPEEKS